MSYDPNKLPLNTGSAETPTVTSILDLATPDGEPAPLGEYAGIITSDVDIALLAELGQAVTRGGDDGHRRWQAPTADSGNPARSAHSAQLVPATTPHTAETVTVH